ncbi:MAG: cobalt-precorrin-6A reductase [Pseudomonadota bacterium]
MRILLLGGSSEASALARELAKLSIETVFSYAGRTAEPIAQPVPVRIGGFGGVAGLRAYLAKHRIDRVVDATHPFAAGMSRNAVNACSAAGVALLALERPPWSQQPGDRWRSVPDNAAAAVDLPTTPARIFLAIGRQGLSEFAHRSEHHYLLRVVDPWPHDRPPPFQSCTIIVSRGPFSRQTDATLMQTHGINWVVSKNAGGPMAGAKIEAARELGLPVTMIARPTIPARDTVATVNEALTWLGLTRSDTADHGATSTRLGV